MKEPMLEPLLRALRIRRVLPVLKLFPDCKLLDVGCGWEARLLKQVEPYIASGTGIDFKAPDIKEGKIATISAVLGSTLPFPDNSFNGVDRHLAHRRPLSPRPPKYLQFLFGCATP